MKKLLLLIVLASLCTNLSYSQCAPIFADDFETGTLLPHWVSGTQSNSTTINSTGSPQGTYHMQYTSATTAHYQGRKAVIPATQISEISWRVKSDGLTNATGYTVIGPTGSTGGTCIFFGYFNNANQYVCTGGPVTHYQPITYGTWYHIELKNINWVTRTLDIYFNNSLVQTGFAFRGNGTSVSEVHLYNYFAGTSYFDDVKVYGPISVTVDATPDTICAGETSKVSAVAPTPTDSIRWYDAMSGGNLLATTLSGDSITLTPGLDTTLYAEIYVPNTFSTTIGYTGGLDSFIVPAGVTSLDIDAYGAQGNANSFGIAGGMGGQATGTLAVTPGQTIYIQVGGGGAIDSLAGYNGGGQGGATQNCATAFGGGGGGSTDIMVGGTTTADRVIVAGGGGGAGGNRVQGCGRGSGGGGGGGYFGGGGGAAWPSTSTILATGGSQSAAGIGGTSAYTGAAPGNNGGAGIGAIGGNGGNEIGSNQGGSATALAGGAGGGNTGGNSLYSANWTGTSGAGGSGYTGGTGVTSANMISGVRSGNGQVIINWQVTPCPVQRDAITVNVDSIPTVTATPSSVTSCYGDSVTLVGGGSDTYSWTGGITNNTAFLPASSSTYTVTGTDASGCSNTAMASVTVGAVVPSVFADDFEAATVLPQWTTTNGTATISTTASAQGNNNLQYVGVSSHYLGMKGSFAGAQPTECSWYMKTSSLNNSGYVVLGDSNTASNNGIVFSYFRSTGVLRFYANTSNEYSMPAAANTWYFIELKNINWTAKTYDLYIDNILRQAAFPFRSTTSTYMSEVHLYNFASATANYDDIKISGASIKLSNATTGNAASTAGTGVGTKMQNTNVATEYYDGSCDLIAEISNNASALGSTVTGVTVDATVPTHNGQPYTARWFEITPTNNIAADVKLFFTQDDFDDYNTYATTNSWPLLPTGPSDAAGIANVRVTKNDNAGLGANPLVLTPSSVIWNASGARWEVMVSTPSFSQFRAHAVNPLNTPLPVTFTKFGVRKLGTTDLVEWTTKGEYNNSHFVVQRSADGHNFENLGTVYTQANSGNSSIDLTYEFTDENPMTGHNYYRLEQVDINNNMNYSNIIDIVWATEGSVVSVYPNPTRDVLHVDISTSNVSTVEVKVIDMSGRVVKSVLRKASKGLNTIELSLGELSMGVYGVQVYENNQLTHVQKVRKND